MTSNVQFEILPMKIDNENKLDVILVSVISLGCVLLTIIIDHYKIIDGR
jgi:hypothetical protein